MVANREDILKFRAGGAVSSFEFFVPLLPKPTEGSIAAPAFVTMANMKGLVTLAFAALLWAYVAHGAIAMFREPEHVMAEEWFFLKCWAGAATIATFVGVGLVLRRFTQQP
jgi:hypothetical protein